MASAMGQSDDTEKKSEKSSVEQDEDPGSV